MVEEQIRILRQIQHLLLIRDEDANVGSGEKTDELVAKVGRLAAKLDAEAAGLYARLSAKNRIFMSPLSKGNCSACGLAVPTSLLQHVISKDRMIVCGSCGRILYVPDVKATGVRTEEPDPKFLLSRFSSSKLMAPVLKAKTRDDAIRELVGVLARERIVQDTDKVVAAAVAREKVLSTAVGHGLAFPHMRGVEEGALTFACGVSPSGIDWDGECANLVFFTALPVVASPFYLKLLGAISKTFENGEKLPFVLASSDAKTLWKELNKATRVAVKNM